MWDGPGAGYPRSVRAASPGSCTYVVAHGVGWTVLHRDGHNHPPTPYISREVADVRVSIIRVLACTIGEWLSAPWEFLAVLQVVPVNVARWSAFDAGCGERVVDAGFDDPVG